MRAPAAAPGRTLSRLGRGRFGGQGRFGSVTGSGRAGAREFKKGSVRGGPGQPGGGRAAASCDARRRRRRGRCGQRETGPGASLRAGAARCGAAGPRRRRGTGGFKGPCAARPGFCVLLTGARGASRGARARAAPPLSRAGKHGRGRGWCMRGRMRFHGRLTSGGFQPLPRTRAGVRLIPAKRIRDRRRRPEHAEWPRGRAREPRARGRRAAGVVPAPAPRARAAAPMDCEVCFGGRQRGRGFCGARGGPWAARNSSGLQGRRRAAPPQGPGRGGATAHRVRARELSGMRGSDAEPGIQGRQCGGRASGVARGPFSKCKKPVWFGHGNRGSGFGGPARLGRWSWACGAGAAGSGRAHWVEIVRARARPGPIPVARRVAVRRRASRRRRAAQTPAAAAPRRRRRRPPAPASRGCGAIQGWRGRARRPPAWTAASPATAARPRRARRSRGRRRGSGARGRRGRARRPGPRRGAARVWGEGVGSGGQQSALPRVGGSAPAGRPEGAWAKAAGPAGWGAAVVKYAPHAHAACAPASCAPAACAPAACTCRMRFGHMRRAHVRAALCLTWMTWLHLQAATSSGAGRRRTTSPSARRLAAPRGAPDRAGAGARAQGPSGAGPRVETLRPQGGPPNDSATRLASAGASSGSPSPVAHAPPRGAAAARAAAAPLGQPDQDQRAPSPPQPEPPGAARGPRGGAQGLLQQLLSSLAADSGEGHQHSMAMVIRGARFKIACIRAVGGATRAGRAGQGAVSVEAASPQVVRLLIGRDTPQLAPPSRARPAEVGQSPSHRPTRGPPATDRPWENDYALIHLQRGPKCSPVCRGREPSSPARVASRRVRRPYRFSR